MPSWGSPTAVRLWRKRGRWGCSPGKRRSEGTLTNLPRQISSFIGREKEIDQVELLVWEHRLVTLTCAGGVGKTRLAQAAAGEVVDDFTDGVWYVELAALADPLLATQVVANALEIRPGPGQSLLETILAFFYDRQSLLVLDNCEHLAEACAELAQTLLSRLPRLKILVTSREPLGVNGEVTYRVPSLALPPGEDREPQRLGDNAS